MKFTTTDLAPVTLVDLEPFEDHRGAFARSFCEREFAEAGLASRMVQANLSTNPTAGTLRGLHYQLAPYEEDKLVRCLHGALWDVVVDVREDSPTYLQWTAAELTGENGRAMYVPKGFAHGFITLTDDVLAMYQVSEFYVPGGDWGVRWDDPAVGIDWPREPVLISDKDAGWPLREASAS